MLTQRMHIMLCGMTSTNRSCLLCSVMMFLSFLSAVKTECSELNTASAHTVQQGKNTTVNCNYNKTNDRETITVSLKREFCLCSYMYHQNTWIRQKCNKNISLLWIPETKEISFELLNLQINDSGVYRCDIETQIPPPVICLGVQSTFIYVTAHPAVSVSCERGSRGKVPKMLCTSEGFYPADVEHFWIRDGAFLTNLNSSVTKNVQWTFSNNTDGSHSFTSFLHLPNTPEQVIYSCWVNHSTLNQPVTLNISSTECYGTDQLKNLYWIITGASSAFFTVLFLVTICHHLRRRKKCPQSPVGRPLLRDPEPNSQMTHGVYSTLGRHQPVPCRNSSHTTPSLQQTGNIRTVQHN